MKRKLSVVMSLVLATWLMMPMQSNANTRLSAPTLVNQEKVNCDEPAVRCDGVTAYFDIPSFSVTQNVYLRVGARAVYVTSGQSNVAVSGLALSRNYNAFLVYDVAEGCCWVTRYGDSISFLTLDIAGKLPEPEPIPTFTPIPTPTPTPTLAPVSDTPTVTTETATVTTDTSTATTQPSGSTTQPSSSGSSSGSTETTTVRTDTATATTDYNQLRTAFELVLANFNAFVAFLMSWRG